MAGTTLQTVEEMLNQVEPETLREMAARLAESHVKVCELTSQVGGCAHVSADVTEARLAAMDATQLAALLAPGVWLRTAVDQQTPGS